MSHYEVLKEKYNNFIQYGPNKIVCSIDFSCSKGKKDIRKSGEILNNAIDELTIYNLAIIVCDTLRSNPPMTYEYVINFENDVEKDYTEYKDEILSIIPEGCCLTAYNGNRMDFLILERRFKIDLSQYILIDTIKVEKIFDNNDLRQKLCIDTTYKKLNVSGDGRMHKENLIKFYNKSDVYVSPVIKGHLSSNDALINLDILFSQFYKYGFTCFEEMAEMINYFISIEDKNDYTKFNINYENLFSKVDEKVYNTKHELSFTIGKLPNKTIKTLSNNYLKYILKKYMIPYVKNNEVVRVHDPFIYEILYAARLEYSRRVDNGLI